MPSVNIRLDKKKLADSAGFSAKGQIRMTVKGYLVPDGHYSKWDGDAYELAEIHTRYASPRRPFMYNARKMISEDPSLRDRVARAIKRFSRVSKRTGEVLVRWNAVGDWTESLIRSLLKGGRLGLKPLQPDTVARKERYGYGGVPLYASGGLAECITYEAV